MTPSQIELKARLMVKHGHKLATYPKYNPGPPDPWLLNLWAEQELQRQQERERLQRLIGRKVQVRWVGHKYNRFVGIITNIVKSMCSIELDNGQTILLHDSCTRFVDVSWPNEFPESAKQSPK